MVISGKFQIKQAPASARFGTGLGQGLAESIPKQVQQYQLQQGLKNFSENAENMSPLQQAAAYLSIPGISPQAQQILPQLVQQQNMAQALQQKAQEEREVSKFPTFQERPEAPTAGLTTRPGIQAHLESYIPMTQDQINSKASRDYKENPKFYRNDPSNAIAAVREEDARNQAISQSYREQRAHQQNLQRDVQKSLGTQAGLLNTKIPGNEYSEIEQKAIRSVLPKDQGGEGLTDEEAKIKYGNELDEVSRDYSALEGIGKTIFPSENVKKINREIDSLRNRFKERGTLENFADTLIAKNGLTPAKSYLKAYPISDLPELNKMITKLPDIRTKTTNERGFLETRSIVDQTKATEMIAPRLAQLMGKEGSPLSIAEELSAKGYDPEPFLRYLNENTRKLDLTGRQQRELGKKGSFLPALSDIWLFSLINEDKYVE